MRRTILTAAVSAALLAPAAEHAQARSALARHTMHRLAHRAQRLHHLHPHRPPSAHSIFLRLCWRWRATHRRPAPDAVVPSIRLAARRHGLSAAGMLRVAECESRLRRDATNGQYLGLFQLGGYARARYLRGSWRDAYANAEAAARYASSAGGFAPWSCGYAYA